jgi:hypothetical protein
MLTFACSLCEYWQQMNRDGLSVVSDDRSAAPFFGNVFNIANWFRSDDKLVAQSLDSATITVGEQNRL